MQISRRQLLEIIREEIRKVKGGYKVYPKKPKRGEKRRKALSKKPHRTYKAALRQLRAVERSKALAESLLQEAVEKSKLEDAIDNAITKLEMSDIPNLKDFMLEIANAESGHNPKGLSNITHYNDNPFQMTNIAIKATSVQGDGSEQEDTKEYREAFARNASAVNPWKDQDYAEIKKNLKMSTMAAAMYIMLQLDGKAIGSTTEARAPQWESLYNKEADYLYKDDAVKRAKKTESQIAMYKRKNP